MVTLSRSVPVNPEGVAPRLTRSDVWRGLELKARDAVPFVPLMSACVVVEEHEGGLVRDIVFAGEPMRELITFFPERLARFERLCVIVPGTMENELEESDGE